MPSRSRNEACTRNLFLAGPKVASDEVYRLGGGMIRKLVREPLRTGRNCWSAMGGKTIVNQRETGLMRRTAQENTLLGNPSIRG